MYKIGIVGAGYVGLSLATLLATKNQVSILEILENKVNQINNRISPIKDDLIEDYFKNKDLNLLATSSAETFYNQNNDLVILAVPTNYDPQKNFFDTSILDNVIKDITENKKFNLIEALAENIASEVLEKFTLINQIMVRVKKPEAPVRGMFDYFAVEIRRDRNE